jgi:hypothetical protein
MSPGCIRRVEVVGGEWVCWFGNVGSNIGDPSARSAGEVSGAAWELSPVSGKDGGEFPYGVVRLEVVGGNGNEICWVGDVGVRFWVFGAAGNVSGSARELSPVSGSVGGGAAVGLLALEIVGCESVVGPDSTDWLWFSGPVFGEFSVFPIVSFLGLQ